jgi:hypothetical protein
MFWVASLLSFSWSGCSCLWLKLENVDVEGGGGGGGDPPVGQFSPASEFAFEKKGAYFGQVALVIRVASGETTQLITNRRRGIGAARGVYCFLLPGKELAVDGGGGDHGSGAVLR